MSFRTEFDRICNEVELLNAAANALMSKRFTNNEEIVAIHETMTNARERILKNATLKNVTVESLIQTYEYQREAMRLKRIRNLKMRNKRKADRELMLSINKTVSTALSA